MLGVSGFLSLATLERAGLVAIPFAVVIVIGSKLFARFSAQRFRQMTIGLMFMVSVVVLLA